MRRAFHWLLMWPCLWIGTWFYNEENWWSEEATLHWLKSRRFFYE